MSVSEPEKTEKQIKRDTAGREASHRKMLAKCHCLAVPLYENGFAWPDGTPAASAHDALKAYAEAEINYRGSLSEISHSRLRRLCASLDKRINRKKYQDPREKFMKATQPEADAAAFAGRKDSKIDGFANAADLLLIQRYAELLGWDALRLNGWIRKQTGKCLQLNQIHTVAQVNRVLWPMKRMVRYNGGKDRPAAGQPAGTPADTSVSMQLKDEK